MTLNQLAKLILLASLWGASFLFIRMAVPFFGPVPLSWLRSVVATLTLFPLLVLSGKAPLFRQYWKHLIVIALISTAIPQTCLSITTRLTSAGFASILNALTPIFSALLAWLWMSEGLSIAAVIGVFLGFGGVTAMVFDRDTVGSGIVLVPVLVGMLAAFLYGFTGLYTRRFTPGVPALVVATGSQVFAAVALLPIAILQWPDTPIPPVSWLYVAFLGVFATGLAFIIYFHLLETVGVVRTVIVTYLVPVFAMLWGYLVLDEIVTPQMMAGTVLILAGIGLTTYRPRKLIVS